jgi:hypothetical protein
MSSNPSYPGGGSQIQILARILAIPSDYSWISPVTPEKYQCNNLNYITTSSFHIFSNSLVTDHPVFRPYVLWATDRRNHKQNVWKIWRHVMIWVRDLTEEWSSVFRVIYGVTNLVPSLCWKYNVVIFLAITWWSASLSDDDLRNGLDTVHQPWEYQTVPNILLGLGIKNFIFIICCIYKIFSTDSNNWSVFNNLLPSQLFSKITLSSHPLHHQV